MFALVEFNKNFEENYKILEKNNLTPIVLFKIIFNNKNQIKSDLNSIKTNKQKINSKYSAILIEIQKIENQTTNIINELRSEFNLLLGQGGLNKINQFFSEQTNIDFLLDPQNQKFKPKIDFIHHFNSGLNHILAKTLKAKNISLMFSLNEIQNKYNVKEIGRINQNIKFARKYNILINLSFIIHNPNQIKSQNELKNIHSLFNISNNQIKESLNLLEKKISENIDKKSPKHISKGITIT